MKKKLLLLCAFMASIGGAWAQTNLASGKSVVIDNTTSGNTYTDAQKLLVTDGVINFGSEDASVNLMLTNGSDKNKADWFYIDLGESQDIASVSISWTNCRPNTYKIYVSSTQPTSGNYGTEAYSQTADVAAQATTAHVFATTQTGQYVAFVPGETAVNGWGCIMSEFQVLKYETPVLTTLALSASVPLIATGGVSELTLSKLDQFGASIDATVNYSVSPAGAGEVADGKFTASASATGQVTITATAGEKSASTSVYVYNNTTTPVPDDASGADITSVYTGGDASYWAPQGYGQGSEQADFDLTAEKKARLGYNLGSMQRAHEGSMETIDFGENKTLGAHVFATKSGELKVRLEQATVGSDDNKTTSTKSFALDAGWNDVQIALSDLDDASKAMIIVFQMEPKAVDNAILVRQIYLSKAEASDPTGVIVTDGVAKVTGTVATAEDAAKIAAADAMLIDLTGVTAISQTFTPKHKNAIIRVDAGDDATLPAKYSALSSMKNLVHGTTYFKPYAQLEFTDENGEPFWNGEGTTVTFLSTGTPGWKITRSLEASTYVSVCLPAAVATLPENVKVYLPTEASATSITFTEQTDVTSLQANKPYILYATAATTLEVSGTGDFYPHGNGTSSFEEAIASTSYKFVGTLAEVSADGTQYALHENEIHKFGNGAKIGSFRAYFTGLTGPAAAIFRGGDGTTGVGSIEADGTVRVMDGAIYNLAGQRVQNPTRGLYIVNGKKVIIK